MRDHDKTITTSDFGHYLASVSERDVDLLLMEEFHASDKFVAWFCEQVGLVDTRADGAWHSVADADGETDLLLRVVVGDRRVGLLIENKIGAPEQHQQAERYHLRGVRAREAGKFDEFATVICAPTRYLTTLNKTSVYQHMVPYEEIAVWFASQPGRRAAWRSQVIREAIEQSRRGYQVIPHAGHTAFHRAYWRYVVQNHPHILMAQPMREQGKNSTWIVLKGIQFPKRVQLDHFPSKGVLRLCFFRRTIDEAFAIRKEWPEDIQVRQIGGSVTLALAVPPINMSAPFGTQRAAVDDVLRAAYRLMIFATLFETPGADSIAET